MHRKTFEMDIQQLKEKVDQLSNDLSTMRDSIEAERLQKKLEHLKHEMANSVTHGIGVIFFLIAVPVLMAYCVRYSTRDYTVCAGIFAFGLMITYLSGYKQILNSNYNHYGASNY